MPEVAVVNTSPIVLLAKAQRLELLHHLGTRRVAIPDSVFLEVTQGGHDDIASEALLNATWIERIPATSVPQEVSEWDLGAGESAVIAACLAIPDSIAVIDDLSGRRCARALGIPLRGTIGVCVAAHRRGAVPDLKALILELRARGMWLSDRVIDTALKLAES
jgi:predicted nucleic acid-binding protein